MFINRHNYEEFFILYLDNELTTEERREVDLFVQENPDLKEELDILLQSKIVPDEAILFDGKEKLMKFSEGPAISLNNYEEWLLLYTDNELNAAQKKEVENFAATNSSVKTELELLLQARLQPEENIVFPYKESLYRKEEKVRVIAFNWKRIAVAASLLLAVGTTAILLLNKKDAPADQTASADPSVKKIQPVKEVTGNPQTAAQSPTNQPVMAQTVETNEKSLNGNQVALVHQKKIKETPSKIISSPVQQKQDETAVVTPNANGNKLPAPRNNPYINTTVEPGNTVAKNDLRKEPSLTIQKENKALPPVTTGNTQPSDLISVAANEPVETTDMNMPEKKTKLRGFFRKVTRTFEKTTNIKATDDDDRLLLGGLAIKL